MKCNSATEIRSSRKHYDFSSAPLQAREIVIRSNTTNLKSTSDNIGLDNITFSQVPEKTPATESKLAG